MDGFIDDHAENLLHLFVLVACEVVIDPNQEWGEPRFVEETIRFIQEPEKMDQFQKNVLIDQYTWFRF